MSVSRRPALLVIVIAVKMLTDIAVKNMIVTVLRVGFVMLRQSVFGPNKKIVADMLSRLPCE